MSDRVDSDPIEPILFNYQLHPFHQRLTHPRVVLIEVGQISQPTVLDGVLRGPLDLALGVVMARLVEWSH